MENQLQKWKTDLDCYYTPMKKCKSADYHLNTSALYGESVVTRE